MRIALIIFALGGLAFFLIMLVVAPINDMWAYFIPFAGAILCTICIVVLLLRRPIMLGSKDFKFIQPGFAAQVKDRKGRIKTYSNSDVQQMISFYPNLGEAIEPLDCRERSTEFTNTVTAQASCSGTGRPSNRARKASKAR